MSSKVVHLAEETHVRAKDFCQEHSLRMSDWVASLIDEAIVNKKTDTKVRTYVPKKKLLDKIEPERSESDVAPWSQPPFWSNKA